MSRKFGICFEKMRLNVAMSAPTTMWCTHHLRSALSTVLVDIRHIQQSNGQSFTAVCVFDRLARWLQPIRLRADFDKRDIGTFVCQSGARARTIAMRMRKRTEPRT
jgi:hypothetical protein